jgi:hypothetical protein
MEFRTEASNKLRSSSVLDQPVRLTSPRSWIAIGALTLAVVVAALWAVFGTLPRQLSVAGVLMPEHGFFTVQSVLSGQVLKLDVEPGQDIRAGSRVATISDGKKRSAVRATSDGRVVSLSVKVGQVIVAGAPIAIAENTPEQNSGLVAELYLPDSVNPDVKAGSRVDIDVASVPARQYGMLRGTVRSVAKSTETSAEISEFLGDDKAGRVLGSDSGARKVVVELEPAEGTSSGYLWSSASGPPFKVGARTNVTGLIEQQPMRPIAWVLG